MHSPKGSYNFEKISSIYHSWCKFLSALAFIRVLILVTEKDTNPHAIIWTAVQISSARSGHMVRKYYPGMQITQWDKGPLTSPALLSFVLKVPVRYLCPAKFIPYHVTRSCKGPIGLLSANRNEVIFCVI